MDKCKEHLINIVDIAEKQIDLIKIISGFTDVHLSPQIRAVQEAKRFLKQEHEGVEI